MSSLLRGLSYRHLTSFAGAVTHNRLIEIHPEVQEALHAKNPVVALESTIITHGMPYPVNLNTARSVENIVRSTGSIPATIGLINGRVKIGLEPSELERLAESRHSPAKLSRRDIGPATALSRDGGTTCSATLIFAAAAGIKVFATGGLGGVHRGGQDSLDISADLHELTRCPVGLVSAGVKSILDIGRTLEYLETLGVPVVTYGENDDFPAFFSPRSGFKSPWWVNDPDAAAEILYNQHQLEMTNGVLFGVPIPLRYHAIGDKIQQAVELAIKETEENGMSRRGKEVTPWLLRRVSELTNKQSLPSNVALIENTARIGGLIAVSYSRIAAENKQVRGQESVRTYHLSKIRPNPETNLVNAKSDLVVVGSAAVDITSSTRSPFSAETSHALYSTVPGSVSISLGGVGRNIAEGAHRLITRNLEYKSASPVLISLIGEDSFGDLLKDHTKRLGMRTDGLISSDQHCSAVCNMILDQKGSLITGVADMDIVKSLSGQQIINKLRKYDPHIVALDGNLSPEALTEVVTYCNEKNIPVFFEPTSVLKSTRILPSISNSFSNPNTQFSPIAYASPNVLELRQLWQESREFTSHDSWWKVIDSLAIGSAFRMDLDQLAKCNASDDDPSSGSLAFLVHEGIAQMAISLLPAFQHLIIKCGHLGAVVVMRAPASSDWSRERSNIHRRYVVSGRRDGELVVLGHFPPHHLPKESVVNVTGAGDTLVAGVLAALVLHPEAFKNPNALSQVIADAQLAATLTLRSPHAVSSELSNTNFS